MTLKLRIPLVFQVEVHYRPGMPGYTSGPPERCYEAEPDELDFYSIQLNGEEVPDAVGDFLSDALHDATLEDILRNHMDALDP